MLIAITLSAGGHSGIDASVRNKRFRSDASSLAHYVNDRPYRGVEPHLGRTRPGVSKRDGWRQ